MAGGGIAEKKGKGEGTVRRRMSNARFVRVVSKTRVTQPLLAVPSPPFSELLVTAAAGTAIVAVGDFAIGAQAGHRVIAPAVNVITARHCRIVICNCLDEHALPTEPAADLCS